MPTILFVDDKPEEVEAVAVEAKKGATAQVVIPFELTRNLVWQADLVLIDFRLEHWPERDQLVNVAFQPMNGLALASVLRAHAEAENVPNVSPTAFALLSAHLADLSGGLPPENRAHIIARSRNLEWVFQKKGPAAELGAQVVALADAVAQLPEGWPTDDPTATTDVVRNLFKIPETDWNSQAIADLQSCHPPIGELSEWSHGLELLRWFAQRVLPYPCFLWDSYRLAARLRVTHESVQRLVDSGSELAKKLQATEYSGVLGRFLGRRWWRAGVEAMLWALTEEKSFNADVLGEVLRRSANDAESLPYGQPVVYLNENYIPAGFCDIADAIRLLPDDWPSYADPAWATVAVIDAHARLRAIIAPEYAGRFEGRAAE